MKAQRRFGARLRKMRMEAGVTLGGLARHLGVQLPYLSDVETGKRPPLSTDRIIATARVIAAVGKEDVDVLTAALMREAALARGAFELKSAVKNPKKQEIGVELMRLWPHLSDQTLDQIGAVLRRESGSHDDEE